MDRSLSLEPTYVDEVRFRAKRELRKRMRSLRSALPPGAIAARSAEIAERLVAHEAFRGAGTVALFMSLPAEVQLQSVFDAARGAGKRVAIPVVTDAPSLVFRAPFDAGGEPALVPGPYGIREPTEAAPIVTTEELDLVVVPALAADTRGHRIGYGAGYYDHTLPLASRAVLIAVAFDFQLIAEVPNRTGDVPVHWIITDRRVLRAEA